MGLFDEMKKLSSSVIDHRLSRKLEKEFWESEEQRERERQASLPARSVRGFSFGAEGFPFDPKPYVSAEIAGSKDSYLDGQVWYADQSALFNVAHDLERLKRMLIPCGAPRVALGFIDLSLVAPVTNPSDPLPENYCIASLLPPTPTGKDPKYKGSISFNAYTEIHGRPSLEEVSAFVSTGSRGKMLYFPNGSIGKADFHIWTGADFVSCEFRMSCGELRVAQIRLVSDEFKKTQTIFKADW